MASYDAGVDRFIGTHDERNNLFPSSEAFEKYLQRVLQNFCLTLRDHELIRWGLKGS